MTSQDQFDRYLSFLEADPENIHLLKSASDLACQLSHFEQAITIAAKGLRLHPDDSELSSTQALAYLSLGRIDGAKQLLNAILEKGEDNPSIRFNLAYCHALESEFPAALALLVDAESHYDTIPQMAHLKINVLHHLGQVEEAIALAEQLLKQQPEDGVLHGLLSTLYIDDVEFELAKQHAELAIKAGHINPDAYTSLGTLALSEQDDTLAIQYFDQVIKLKKNNGRAWLGKAMAEMLKQQFSEAQQSFDSALHYMPKHLGTWQALSWCQLAQKDLDGAEYTIKKALEIDDNFAESHGVMAIIQLTKGNIDLCKTSIRRSLGLDNASFSGLYAQALLLAKQGRADASDKLIQGMLDTPIMPDQRSLREVLIKQMSK